jgi:signal peptidase I
VSFIECRKYLPCIGEKVKKGEEQSEARQSGVAAALCPRTPHWGERKFFRWVEHVLAAVGLCFLIYWFCFETIVMTSDSMKPALQGTSYENGDRVLVEKVTKHWRSPRRWEIYFMYDAEGTPVAKRIVGLPGERVSVKDNQVRINGAAVEPPAGLKNLKYYPMGNLAAGREVKCGTGFFVLGDDSKDSYDSRYLGPVRSSQLRGRVWCILWPRSRQRFL